MAYGISSRPGFFQLQMEEFLKSTDGVAIVIDDIVITSKTDEEHLENLNKILSKIKESGLKVRVDKCKFFKKETPFLGFKINEREISVDKGKFQAINEMRAPKNQKELELFIGKINYYCRMFKDQAKILGPLHDFSKAEKFVWTDESKRAFEDAKKALKQIVVPILLQIDEPIKLLIMTCDAPPKGLSEYLSQPYDDGEKPVAFASKRLSKAHENYSLIDKEAAAIIFRVTKFYDYEYARHFILKTDNKPLFKIFGP